MLYLSGYRLLSEKVYMCILINVLNSYLLADTDG
jgi:hypothetical protein